MFYSWCSKFHAWTRHQYFKACIALTSCVIKGVPSRTARDIAKRFVAATKHDNSEATAAAARVPSRRDWAQVITREQASLCDVTQKLNESFHTPGDRATQSCLDQRNDATRKRKERSVAALSPSHAARAAIIWSSSSRARSRSADERWALITEKQFISS